MYDDRLRQVKLLLDFYFTPWGAAKGEIWEEITGDQEFSAFNMGRWVHGLLEGLTELKKEHIELLQRYLGVPNVGSTS